MRESLAVQEWLAEGRQEGALQEANLMLLSCIKTRFPRLDVRDDVAPIGDIDQLHSLFATVMNAPNSATVRRAVRKAKD